MKKVSKFDICLVLGSLVVISSLCPVADAKPAQCKPFCCVLQLRCCFYCFEGDSTISKRVKRRAKTLGIESSLLANRQVTKGDGDGTSRS